MKGDHPATRKHYQLAGSMAVRMFHNAAVVKEGIITLCGGNPFLWKATKLMNMSSNMKVPETAKEDILFRDDNGSNKFEEFVSQTLVASTAKKSIWNPIKKNYAEDIQYVSEEDKLQLR